jgi:hypothetical protein
LFLDFWADLLPQSKFLFVFRAPWLVVDSLYRRGDEVFEADPKLAIKAWVFYNQAILDFVEARGDEWARQHCLMADIGAIAQYPQAYLEAIRTYLQIPLQIPEQVPVEPALLHQQIQDKDYFHLIQTTFPEAISLYQRQYCFQNALKTDNLASNFISIKDNQDSFNLWQKSRNVRNKDSVKVGENSSSISSKNIDSRDFDFPTDITFDNAKINCEKKTLESTIFFQSDTEHITIDNIISQLSYKPQVPAFWFVDTIRRLTQQNKPIIILPELPGAGLGNKLMRLANFIAFAIEYDFWIISPSVNIRGSTHDKDA